MNTIMERLAAMFAPGKVYHYMFEKLIPDLIVAMITLLAFYVLWRGINHGLRAFFKRAKLDETAQGFVQAVLKYAILTIGVVTALSQLGVNTASILTSLGVAGLTIGFAAKDALSNIISGLFIFWDRPFVIGDLVEVSGQYGRVDEITMRSTRVVTADGKMLAIPNSEVVNTTVASYTNFAHLRIDVAMTVGVSEDLGLVRKTLLDLVVPDERFMNSPEPEVVVTAINDYNVAVELRAWLSDERIHVPVRFELRERAYLALSKAGVDMPLETLNVILKKQVIAATPV